MVDIKEPKRVGFFNRIDPRIIRRTKIFAVRRGVDVHEVVEEALKQFLKNEGVER